MDLNTGVYSNCLAYLSSRFLERPLAVSLCQSLSRGHDEFLLLVHPHNSQDPVRLHAIREGTRVLPLHCTCVVSPQYPCAPCCFQGRDTICVMSSPYDPTASRTYACTSQNVPPTTEESAREGFKVFGYCVPRSAQIRMERSGTVFYMFLRFGIRLWPLRCPPLNHSAYGSRCLNSLGRVYKQIPREASEMNSNKSDSIAAEV